MKNPDIKVKLGESEHMLKPEDNFYWACRFYGNSLIRRPCSLPIEKGCSDVNGEAT